MEKYFSGQKITPDFPCNSQKKWIIKLDQAMAKINKEVHKLVVIIIAQFMTIHCLIRGNELTNRYTRSKKRALCKIKQKKHVHLLLQSHI